jgi:hypothetical protein
MVKMSTMTCEAMRMLSTERASASIKENIWSSNELMKNPEQLGSQEFDVDHVPKCCL